jgi:hypothetical protein
MNYLHFVPNQMPNGIKFRERLGFLTKRGNTVWRTPAPHFP